MTILFADNKHDAASWRTLWEKGGEREPFAHPGYAALFAGDHVRACAAWFREDGLDVLYPFLLRRIPAGKGIVQGTVERYDVVSPYGYGGPSVVAQNGEKVADDRRDKVVSSFFAHFRDIARENRWVSEFVRFSLFSGAHRLYYGQVHHANDNIVCDLHRSDEELWRNYRHKVRKNVARAHDSGLVVAEDHGGERIGDFAEVYYHTLRRRGAADFYFFRVAFFRRLLSLEPSVARLFHVLHGGRVVASEVVLLSASRTYSFLGGTLEEYYPMRPGDLLKHHLLLWARQRGHTDFVIGGGHQPHDGIFAFKEAFAPGSTVPFFVGKAVFDENAYRELCGGKTPAQGDFFPAYRTL